MKPHTDGSLRTRGGKRFAQGPSSLGTLLDALQQQVFIVDRQMKVIWANEAVRRSCRSPIIGQPCCRLFCGRENAGPDCPGAKVFDDGEVHETDIVSPDAEGERRIMRHTASPAFRDAQGKPETVLETLTNITAEQDMQQQTEDFERLQALTQMASGIAHDFNNALSTIQGLTDLLLQTPEKRDEPETLRQYLELISRAAGDAAATVRRMRTFYRSKDTQRFSPLNLNRLITESISITEPRWKQEARGRGAEIDINTHLGDIPPVNGNASEVNDMLTNLIFNAVDAMPQGGTLAFTTERVNNRQIQLVVSDSGHGMSEEIRRYCMDPFYTTKGDEGTGLGLSMVHGIVARHGGTIDIDSCEDKGTTFTIRLPAAGERHRRSQGSDTAEDIRTALNILLVEDEQQQRTLISELLRKDKHRVTAVTNGLEALQMFHAHWYDLVITDLAMPVMNGEQLARSIKKLVPEKPVILLTGFTTEFKDQNERARYISCTITKPTALPELRRAISQAIPPEAQ